jgi:thimet oligopeptidase
MIRLVAATVVLPCVLAGCASRPDARSPASTEVPAGVSVPFEDFAKSAGPFKSVVSLPRLEASPQSVQRSVSNVVTRAETALDQIGTRLPAQITFENTIQALDDLTWQINGTANRLSLVKETSTNGAVREAATEGIKALSEWAVGIDYREDVYRAVKAFAATRPSLRGEDEKLFREVLRDYRRAGLDLPKAERDAVERLRKELTGLMTDFESNITKARKPVTFTKAELEGVPAGFLNQPGIKTGDDEYTVMANVTFHYINVMDNARREDTRKRLMTIQSNLAREENVALLLKILELRDRIARKLAYATWADYQIEPKMAKTATNAIHFCEQLRAGLQPKFAAELEEYRKIKARDTRDAGAKIHAWDWRYFSNQLKKEKYTVDAEQLRVYFPYEKVLTGMFRIYQDIFGVRFQRLVPPDPWCDGLELYAVSDADTGEPLGCFYLDMFPREGKYNHFAQFPIIEGKLLSDGSYQRPTVALVCNFPPPSTNGPSLLSHSDVETLFHEFGHAMHSLLTRAKFARFSGTSVPHDFVEAPSQMLENWVWDKKVLDSFAADYRDPSKKIPPEILAKLKEARLATIGTFYRRQLSFALMDLTLHTQVKMDGSQDVVKLSNEVLGNVFLPVPEKTAFVAYFGHLMGYDAGYYGYAWADAIAADMATVFEKSPRGFHDPSAGRRLRDDIYAPGDSRDVNISIEEFLGRPRSIEPFLDTLGIGKK